MFRSNPVDPLKTRPAVKITNEAQNRSNAMALHYFNVHGVAGGQPAISPARKTSSFSMGNTSSTTSKITWSTGPMASRFSIAVYR